MRPKVIERTKRISALAIFLFSLGTARAVELTPYLTPVFKASEVNFSEQQLSSVVNGADQSESQKIYSQLRSAAQGGNARAAAILGALIESGAVRDFAHLGATELYKRSYELKDPFGYYLFAQREVRTGYKIETKQQVTKMLQYAIDHGVPEAKVELGEILGEIKTKDAQAQALRLSISACSDQIPMGCMRAASFFVDGIFVVQSYEKAAALLLWPMKIESGERSSYLSTFVGRLTNSQLETAMTLAYRFSKHQFDPKAFIELQPR